MNIHEDDRICPLCGKDNGCQHDESCWCHSIKIPQHIFALIPEDKVGKACICKECIDKHQAAE